MSHFSISDIENLCGIKAHTLRIWENRYGFFVARRNEGRHRVYDDNDLKLLLRISFLYHHGYRISDIAAMDPQALEDAVNRAEIPAGQYHLYIHRLVEASLSFDKGKLESVVQKLVQRIGMDDAITEVFYPFLKRIGLLWMTNHLVPAQEHFCSHLISKKIIYATDRLPDPPGDAPLFVVFAPAGEFHELPLLTANYFLRRHGCRTVYLGRNLEVETLCLYLDRHPAPYLFTNLVTPPAQEKMKEFLEKLTGIAGIERIYISGAVAEGSLPGDRRFVLLQKAGDLIDLAREKHFA